MARGRSKAQPGLDLASYLLWTRDATVSLALLLPLLLVYEVGLWRAGVRGENAAGWLLKSVLHLPGTALVWLQALVVLTVLLLAVHLARRRVPLLQVYPVLLLEALALALILGPLMAGAVHWLGLQNTVNASPWQDWVLSIGAGVYEEVLFRFLILAGSYSMLARVLHAGPRTSLVVSLLVSATLFTLYHHAGPQGEPLELVPVLFRFLAGILLGVLFVCRGLALCAYVHALYDLLVDLKAQALLS